MLCTLIKLYTQKSKSLTDSLLFELTPRLGQLAVELHHLPSKQGSEFAEHFLVPGVILECHLALHARKVYHDGAVLAARVGSIEGRTGLPRLYHHLHLKKNRGVSTFSLKKNLYGHIDTSELVIKNLICLL